MDDAVLSVRNLYVGLRLESGTISRIVRGVSFDVAPGEFAAIVGESGCGKSMTAMALSRLPPTDRAELSGSVVLDGRDLAGLSPRELRAVRGRGIAYVFQDPQSSLNPVLTVRTQLREALPPGTPRAEADRLLAGLLETVRVPDPARVLRSYPHELSGGLQQRVGIAMAVAASPRLLVADEPTTALDVTTQKSVLDLLDRLRRERGIALLLITHNLGLVARYADTVHVMYAGEIVESGPVPDVLGRPAHPYTEGLLAAVPSLDLQGIDGLRGIPGRVPMPSEWPAGCAFAPRCPRAAAECTRKSEVQSPKSEVRPRNPATLQPDSATMQPCEPNSATLQPCNSATSSHPRRPHISSCLRAGFSLLEVVAVLLILALLAGFVVGQARLAKVRGEEARARTDLGILHTALERYRSSLGQYPSSKDTARDESGGPDGSCIVTNLAAWTEAPSWMMEGVSGADDVYCLRNFVTETEKTPFTGLDPWNRPYRYVHDPDAAPDIYRLFSYGPADPKGEHPDRWIFFED